jgi:hypothetical protein
MNGGVSGEDTVTLVLTAMCVVLDHAIGGYAFRYDSAVRKPEED